MEFFERLKFWKPRKKSAGVTFSEFMREFAVDAGLVDARNAYKKNVWVYACIRAISNGVNGVPCYIRNEKSQERVAKTDPWDRLMRNPNPLMVASQLWKKHIILTETKGECFWLLFDPAMKPIKSETVPDSIWVYGPDKVTPWVDKDTSQFLGWKFQPRLDVEKYVFFKPWQVLRFYDVDPDNDFKAVAPTQPTEVAIKVQAKAMGFNDAFLDQGAMIDGVINIDAETYNALGDEGIENMQERFQDRYGGFKKRGKVPVIAGGEFKPTGAGPKDMDFSNLNEATREEIIAGFGVPEHQVGMTKNLNLATATEEAKLFYTGNIIPKMTYWATVINDKLLIGTGREFHWDFHSIKALQDAMDSKVLNATALVTELGYPLNEVNAKLELGMDEIKEPWANKAVDPRTLNVPPPIIPEPNGKPRPKPVKLVPLPPEVPLLTRDAGRDYAHEYWYDVCRLVEEPFRRKMVSYWLRLKKDQLARWDEKFGKRAPSSILTKDTEDSYREVLFDSDKWDGKLKQESLPFHEQAFNNSIAYLREEVDTFYHFKPGSNRVANLLAEKNSQITGVNDRFKAKLLQSLADGVEAGETLIQLRQRIVDDFTEKIDRAMDIAATETAQAANMIRHYGMEEEGLEKDWLTAKDEHVRHTHNEFGKLGPKPLSYEYAKGLRYPCDPDCKDASLVVRCRCFEKATRKTD